MEMDYFRRLFLFSFSPITFCCIHFISSNFFSLSDPISSSIFGCSCTITCFLFELWLLETKIISKNDHNCFGKDNTFSKRLESKVRIW